MSFKILKIINSILNWTLRICGLVAIICLFASMCSCTIQKNSKKNKSSVDSGFVDKSKIKTIETEKVDTIVSTKVDSIKGDFIIDDTTTQVIESEGVKVEIKINKNGKKGSVKAISKPKDIHVSINKVTETEKQNNIKTNIKKEEKSKDIDKKTIFKLPWWLYLIFVIILLLIILYKELRKKFPFLP